MAGDCRRWPCLSRSPTSTGSGSPAAPARGQRGARRADPEGGWQRAPPGNLVTGALATERGRDLERKSEAEAKCRESCSCARTLSAGVLGSACGRWLCRCPGARRRQRTRTPPSPRHGDLSEAGAAAARGGQDQKPALVGGGPAAAGKGIGGRGGQVARPQPDFAPPPPTCSQTEPRKFSLASASPQSLPFF